MERSIKVLQVGCGKMSKYTMRYVYEGASQIVGAVDINPNVIGKDIGDIMEVPNKGVIIEPLENLDHLIEMTEPDIAIVTTMSLLADVHDVIRTLVVRGVNVITTCEEAFFASNSNPNMYQELNAIAKANNCTITGCGYQDIFWGYLISSIAGSTHKIMKIKGSSSYNVEDYGIALAKAHGAGLTLEEFDKEVASVDRMSKEERQKIIDSGKYTPSYMWNVVGWLADKLDLHITSIDQKCVPTTHSKDLKSSTLDMTIKAGNATGMSAIVTAMTEEGVEIEAQCIGKVYSEEDYDANIWTVEGEPNTTITVERPATVELTCADCVNRIPDVMNAEAGFVPTSQLPEPTYRTKPLQEYVK